MSEYMFCVRNGKLTKAQVEVRERVATENDSTFVYANLPGEGHRSWFCTRNYGEPFNGRTARAVREAIEACAED